MSAAGRGGVARYSAPCWSTVTYVTDRGSELCIYYENRSTQILGDGLHLFRKDTVPRSVLVVAIIFVVVLLML